MKGEDTERPEKRASTIDREESQGGKRVLQQLPDFMYRPIYLKRYINYMSGIFLFRKDQFTQCQYSMLRRHTGVE